MEREGQVTAMPEDMAELPPLEELLAGDEAHRPSEPHQQGWIQEALVEGEEHGRTVRQAIGPGDAHIDSQGSHHESRPSRVQPSQECPPFAAAEGRHQPGGTVYEHRRNECHDGCVPPCLDLEHANPVHEPSMDVSAAYLGRTIGHATER